MLDAAEAAGDQQLDLVVDRQATLHVELEGPALRGGALGGGALGRADIEIPLGRELESHVEGPAKKLPL